MDGDASPPRDEIVAPEGLATLPIESFRGAEQSVWGRRWHERAADPGLAAAIAERHGLPEIVGRLLAQRGIGVAEAPGFLAPRLRDLLPDPAHLRDMDR